MFLLTCFILAYLVRNRSGSNKRQTDTQRQERSVPTAKEFRPSFYPVVTGLEEVWLYTHLVSVFYYCYFYSLRFMILKKALAVFHSRLWCVEATVRE